MRIAWRTTAVLWQRKRKGKKLKVNNNRSNNPVIKNYSILVPRPGYTVPPKLTVLKLRTETSMASIADFQQNLLERESTKPQNQLVLQTVRELSAAFVYPERTNVETNRKLWDEYAKSWDDGKCEWVQTMAGHVGREGEMLEHVGDEWSDSDSLQQVLDEFLFPLLHMENDVLEIGTGGGRIATEAVTR